MQEQIFDALRRHDAGGALALAEAAVAADPGQAQPLLWLAMAQRAAGRQDDAIASIDRAIALAPEDAGLHFHRAGLLLGRRDMAAAQAALSDTLALDPNQYPAYIVQAQLALGRGDLDEAERLQRLAGRIEPEHPWTRTIAGLLAMRRGRNDEALSLLSQAQQQAPDDGQVLHAYGLALLAAGHLAFAEQAFDRLLALTPGAVALRPLLAQLRERQDRPGDALETLQPMLAGDGAAPALRQYAARLALRAARPQDALLALGPLLDDVAGEPQTLGLAVEAWRRSDRLDQARDVLDAAVAASPDNAAAWRGRLACERVGDAAADAVIARWLAAMPGHLQALEAQLQQQSAKGEHDAAHHTAEAILAQAPDHGQAGQHLVGGLIERDPAAAIAWVQARVDAAGDEALRMRLRGWLALVQDRAGDMAGAVETWRALQASIADQSLPLLARGPAQPALPPMATPVADAPAVAFLHGLPGSGVEQVAEVLRATLPAFRTDRLGPTPPGDALQVPATAGRLAAGELTPAGIARDWRERLPARGIGDGQVLDWLPWWDNGLLAVLREQLPHARLLMVVRDPRDMLLHWLSFGGAVAFRFDSPEAAADWLAQGLEHVATLEHEALFPHQLLRVDEAVGDLRAIAALASQALQVDLPAPPAQQAFVVSCFPAGHWRRYAGVLAEAFARLGPVAQRLGYPQD